MRTRAADRARLNNLDPATATSTLRVDVKARRIRAALDQAGVAHVILKGPAFAALLYDQPRSRPYGDLDVLVRPADRPDAHRVLEQLGFARFDVEAPSSQIDREILIRIGATGAHHGGGWVRVSDGMAVDVHHTLPQVPASAEALWELLDPHIVDADIAGTPGQTLDPAASALLVALHAAHHGPGAATPLADLERAVVKIRLPDWRTAAEIARRVDAQPAMGAGLGLHPDGVRLAGELGLKCAPTEALQMLWAGATWTEVFAKRVAAEPRARTKVALLARALVPSPVAMRGGSTVAGRGRAGLALAYLTRSIRLVRLAAGEGRRALRSARAV